MLDSALQQHAAKAPSNSGLQQHNNALQKRAATARCTSARDATVDCSWAPQQRATARRCSRICRVLRICRCSIQTSIIVASAGADARLTEPLGKLLLAGELTAWLSTTPRLGP